MTAGMVWYVSYGSNMAADRMNAYLAGSDSNSPYGRHDRAANPSPPQAVKPFWLNYPMYFAGQSVRWRGAVAFVGLWPSHESTPAVAYLVTYEQFLHLAAGENGVRSVDWGMSLLAMRIGSWAPIPVFSDGKPTRAKYNALLRLPDMDGIPAVTVTTWRDLPLGEPSPEYLDVVSRGLAESGLLPTDQVSGCVDEMARRSRISGCQPIPLAIRRSAHPVAIRLAVVIGSSTGFPSVHVPAEFAEFNGSTVAPMLGWVVTPGGHRIGVWVFPTLQPGEGSEISPHLADQLHRAGAPIDEVTLLLDLPLGLTRIPGRGGDIPPTDVVQVNPMDKPILGDWVLVTSPRLSAPMKVLPREHVAIGQVRVAYAARLMLGLRPGDTVTCQPVPVERESWRQTLQVRIAKTLEWAIGAPAIAFRSVEGLAGDDGLPIVRVDVTALDYLGAASGDRVVVTWASRRAYARVLLHTDTTRAWMHKQLSETTGAQTKARTGDVESRLESPEHLRVWISSTVRSTLGIPSDTAVRLRRSMGYLLLKNGSLLAIPLTGLVVALFVLPPGLAIAVTLVIVCLVLAPLRLK